MSGTSTIGNIKPRIDLRAAPLIRHLVDTRLAQTSGGMKLRFLLLSILIVALSTAAMSSFAALPQIDQQRFDGIDEVIGKSYQVSIRPEDTLHTVARRFHTGLEEIRLANPTVDTWLPDVKSQVTIPSQFVLPALLREKAAEGAEPANTLAVINLPELRLYLKRNGVVTTYPISVGRPGWPTPSMDTRVTQKRVNPSWRPPASIIEAAKQQGETIAPLYLPGPSNPLGKYAIRLGQTAYLIHGTNKPSGVGLRASHGCIRMYPEHVEVVFGRLFEGDRVVVVDEPIKVGWLNGELMMEVHPALQEAGMNDQQLYEQALDLAREALAEAGVSTSKLDEGDIIKLVTEQTGVPSAVTRNGIRLPNG